MRESIVTAVLLVLSLGSTRPGLTQGCDPAPECVPPPASLVNAYPGETSGADAVGSLDLVLNGTTAPAPAIVGNGLLFDAPGDFAQNLTPASTQLTDWTFSCWIDWRGLRAGQRFQIAFHNGNGGLDGYGLLVDGFPDTTTERNPGELVIVLGGINLFPTGFVLDPVSARHHVALRSTPTATETQVLVELYVDGMLEFAGVTPTPETPSAADGIGSPGGLTISRGVASGPGDIGFEGIIDEFDVFDSALAPATITAIFDAGCSGKCTEPEPPEPPEDTDGDGIPDDKDSCTNSDASGTIVIGEVDTGVTNDFMDDGCSLMDLICSLLDSDPSQSEIVALLVDLKAEGYITGREMGSILRTINRG